MLLSERPAARHISRRLTLANAAAAVAPAAFAFECQRITPKTKKKSEGERDGRLLGGHIDFLLLLARATKRSEAQQKNSFSFSASFYLQTLRTAPSLQQQNVAQKANRNA